MAVFRWLGWLLLLVTIAVGAYETIDYFDGDRTLSTVAEMWGKVDAASLAGLQELVQRHLGEDAWTSFAQVALAQPALLAFGGAALFCLFVGNVFRRRSPESPAARRRRRRR